VAAESGILVAAQDDAAMFTGRGLVASGKLSVAAPTSLEVRINSDTMPLVAP
jgi:hypothetical protein